jgi:hypothetical protein
LPELCYNIGMNNAIPNYIKSFLWSYDFTKIDLEKDKKRIITNILNYGTKEATDWLFSVYNKDSIKETIEKPFSGEWNKKSLYFWSFVFNIKAGDTLRKI